MIIDEVALLDGSEIEGLSPVEKKALLFRKLASASRSSTRQGLRARIWRSASKP